MVRMLLCCRKKYHDLKDWIALTTNKWKSIHNYTVQIMIRDLVIFHNQLITLITNKLEFVHNYMDAHVIKVYWFNFGVTFIHLDLKSGWDVISL